MRVPPSLASLASMNTLCALTHARSRSRTQLSLSNIEIEYNDEAAAPLDSDLLDKRIGDICTGKDGQPHTIKVKFSGCVGFGVCCMLVGCCTKVLCGYGDPRKTVPWMNMDPAKQWPLTAAVAETAAAPKQQVMGDPAGMDVRAVPAAATV